MSYTKQTWNTGDTITAEKLNHMEDGIASSGGGFFTITATPNGNTWSMDKTFDEIMTAYNSGMLPVVLDSGENVIYPFSGVLVGSEKEFVFESCYVALEGSNANIFTVSIFIFDDNSVEVQRHRITVATSSVS